MDAAVYELRCRKFLDLEHGTVLLHNIIATSLAVQCENLGVPYDSERVKELTGALHLEYQKGHTRGSHVITDVPDGWCGQVDRMFQLRRCARCRSLLFPGMHSQDECDREIVRSVMES